MTTITGKRRSAKGSLGHKVGALITAVAVALGIAAIATPAASADNREMLGPNNCAWSDYNNFVQNCWFWSASMGQDIQVQIKRSNSDAAIYMLDGLRARDDWNGWTNQGHGVDLFVNDDVNVIMPVGGAAQFYADWKGTFQGPTTPKNPMWETFLTSELPAQLQAGYGISPNRNAVVGLSMGATAALTLAAHHRDQFKQATALSGYLSTTFPGMYLAIEFAMAQASFGANVWDMWGGPLDLNRVRNDPLLNVPKMNGLPIYLASAAGIMNWNTDVPNFFADPIGGISGIMLERMSAISTGMYDVAARIAGARVTTSYPLIGVHNWTLWNPELAKARPAILNALGIGAQPQPGSYTVGSLSTPF